MESAAGLSQAAVAGEPRAPRAKRAAERYIALDLYSFSKLRFEFRVGDVLVEAFLPLFRVPLTQQLELLSTAVNRGPPILGVSESLPP